MPTATTSYTPSQVSTVTSGAPAAGYGDALQQMIADRMRAAQEDRAYMLAQRNRQGQRPMMGAAPPPPPQAAPRMDAGPSAIDQQLDFARKRDEIMQMQARQQPAPMRAVTGFNMIGSAGGQDTMDVNAMNAYQRQAYLPEKSEVSYSPENAADAKAAYDQNAGFAQQMAADRLRTAGTTGEVGGRNPGGAPAMAGTSPILTPANASAPPRKLSPEEQKRQREVNARYGH